MFKIRKYIKRFLLNLEKSHILGLNYGNRKRKIEHIYRIFKFSAGLELLQIIEFRPMYYLKML